MENGDAFVVRLSRTFEPSPIGEGLKPGSGVTYPLPTDTRFGPGFLRSELKPNNAVLRLGEVEPMVELSFAFDHVTRVGPRLSSSRFQNSPYLTGFLAA